MIRIILVTLFFLGVSQANNCFDTAFCGRGWGAQTHYHCIMKCANSLTKETMDMLLDNMQDKINHQCIWIENLDYCIQYYRQHMNMDCEGPIKNMVKQNFQVSNIYYLVESLRMEHDQRTYYFLGYIGYI